RCGLPDLLRCESEGHKFRALLAGLDPRAHPVLNAGGIEGPAIVRVLFKAAAGGGHAEPLVMGSDALLPSQMPFQFEGHLTPPRASDGGAPTSIPPLFGLWVGMV